MAIYLDANALFSWPTLTELQRVALSAVASQLQQDIVIPSLVVEESHAHRRRALEAVVETYERAARAVERAFPTEYIHVEPYPDVDEAMATWSRVLNQFAVVIETQARHALEGLRREIAGIPPAKSRQRVQSDDQRNPKRKPGAGGRDAAIWMAIVEDVRQRAEPAHLITDDAEFADGRALRAELAAEVAPYEMTLYASVSDFVAQLGRPIESTIAIADVERRGTDAVVAAVASSDEVGLMIWRGERIPDRHRSRVHSASIASVTKMQGYESTDGDAPFVVADTIWEIHLDVLFKSDNDALDEDSWYVIEGCDIRIAAQMYLQATRAEVVGLQIKDSPSAIIRDDGVALIIGRSRPVRE